LTPARDLAVWASLLSEAGTSASRAAWRSKEGDRNGQQFVADHPAWATVVAATTGIPR